MLSSFFEYSFNAKSRRCGAMLIINKLLFLRVKSRSFSLSLPILFLIRLGLLTGTAFIAQSSAISESRVFDLVIPKSEIALTSKKYGQTSIDSSRIQSVLMGDPGDEGVPSQFVVHGISVQDREYCVFIHSANNLFSASFSFRNVARVKAYRVRLEIDNWNALRPRYAGELSIQVRAKLNGRCSGPLLPTRWGAQLDITDGFVLYNGGQSLSALVQIGGRRAVECKHLAGELLSDTVQGVSFNYACPIQFAQTYCGKDTVVLVLRENSEQSHSNVDRARVRLVCPNW